MAGLFSEKKKLLGYVSIDSGSLIMVDGAWATAIPRADDSRVLIDLEEIAGKLPVYSFLKDSKRYILIQVDDLIPTEERNEFADVEVEP